MIIYDSRHESNEDAAPTIPVVGELFLPNQSVYVTTESSIWTFLPDPSSNGGFYVRSPKGEGPRPPALSISGRLDDDTWHEYTFAHWSNAHLPAGQVRLQVKPAVGPATGFGVLTGVVLEITPFVPATA